jgi:2-keto-4-pentenoate hydratase/2-oxohepta-3-ene-1,7-dioic acid hydratase in catechol pathway
MDRDVEMRRGEILRMKLVTMEVITPLGRTRRLGALTRDEQRIVDLNAAFRAHLECETDEPTPEEFAALRMPPDMLGWLRAGSEGMRAAAAAMHFAERHATERAADGATLVFARSDVRLLAPLPRPASFRDFSMYEEHMHHIVKNPEWYTNPTYYKGSCTAIAGPEDPIPWPYYTKLLDLELEIGIVVGKRGSNLTIEEAQKHIAGYTILVDSSCREGQKREPLGPTKRKDWHTALGPFLRTADEIDIEHLDCSLSVDGETWYEGNTSAPHGFSPAQLVAYVSDCETIYPGDLIGTGTISYSCSMDTNRWIQIGQTATFRVAGLGEMNLRVIEQPPVVTHVGSGMRGHLTAPA